MSKPVVKPMARLGLPACAYNRTLVLAFTLANLGHTIDINSNLIAEAIQYRTLNRSGKTP
jgi:predicted ATPase with chaperone activity